MERVAEQPGKNDRPGTRAKIYIGVRILTKGTCVHAHCHPVLSLVPANDEMLVARMTIVRMTPAGEARGRRGKQTHILDVPAFMPLPKLTIMSEPHRPSNHRPRHRRRPSTIAEERPESLQLALEHAAEHLAEDAIEPAMDIVRSRRSSTGDRADEGADDEAVQAQGRTRRRRTEH